jgi:hypothetical protein
MDFLDSFLLAGETMMEKYDDVVLTNLRVIVYKDSLSNKDFQDVHYRYLESVGFDMVRSPGLLVFGFFLLLASFVLLCVWLTSDVKDTSFLAWSVLSGILGFGMIIGFFVLGRRLIVFRGHNTELRSRTSDDKLIKRARELQRDYFIRTKE